MGAIAALTFAALAVVAFLGAAAAVLTFPIWFPLWIWFASRGGDQW